MRAYIMHRGGLVPLELWTDELVEKWHSSGWRSWADCLCCMAVRLVSLKWISVSSLECGDKLGVRIREYVKSYKKEEITPNWTNWFTVKLMRVQLAGGDFSEPRCSNPYRLQLFLASFPLGNLLFSYIIIPHVSQGIHLCWITLKCKNST